MLLDSHLKVYWMTRSLLMKVFALSIALESGFGTEDSLLVVAVEEQLLSKCLHLKGFKQTTEQVLEET